MKKLYFLLFTILTTAVSLGQTTVFQESFETGNSGIPSETCNDNGSDFFTRTNGSDISSGYVVTGMDGTFFFAAQDIDGAPCTLNPQTLLFDDINISSFTNLTLAILLAEDDSSDGNEDWDGGDLFYIEVDYDNSGSFTKIMQFATTATTGFNVSAPMRDTNLDGIGDGTELTPTFGEFTISLGTGNLVDIRLVFVDLAAGDEDIAIDNIRVVDGFIANPTISITAPTNGTTFAPGTTSVNVEWSTANLGGSETVDITINGSQTTGVTSPFAVTTTDGQTYNITVDLVDGGVIDSDMTSFSVGSLTQVTDIAALIADVGSNGVGGFYEITGAVLVTHTDGFNNRQWIQDGNISGILMYDSGNVSTTYTVGDNVTGLKGTTTTSNGVLRFVPTEDSGIVASSGNPVTPQVVTIAAFNAAPDDYESELIRINNVTFDIGDGVVTFATGTNYNVSVGADIVIKRTDFFSADYIGQLVPVGQIPGIVGVAGEYNGTAQIYVRSLSDMTLSSSKFDLNEFAVYPNPTSTGFVNIVSKNNETIEATVFDILGKQVINSTVINNKLDVSNLNIGVYIMRLTQNNATITKKLVIK